MPQAGGISSSGCRLLARVYSQVDEGFQGEFSPIGNQHVHLARGSITMRSIISSVQQVESTVCLSNGKVGGSTESMQRSESCLVQMYPADVVNGMRLLQTDRYAIGRDSSSDLRLLDTSISRQHAVLIRDDEGFMVRDLGSTNGTLVNGNRTDQQRLKSGDSVQLGIYIFKFLSAGSVERKYHAELYSALTRDALTGMMNKRYLEESMEREVARAIRQRVPIGVVMMDIDHFKRVNDTLGHLVGDEVLHDFGASINAVLRADDLLARYGGEEFCLLLYGADRAETQMIAKRCRQSVAKQPFETAAGPIDITASFGFACLDPASPVTPEQLIEQADTMLYEAKERGRNLVCG